MSFSCGVSDHSCQMSGGPAVHVCSLKSCGVPVHNLCSQKVSHGQNADTEGEFYCSLACYQSYECNNQKILNAAKTHNIRQTTTFKQRKAARIIASPILAAFATKSKSTVRSSETEAVQTFGGSSCASEIMGLTQEVQNTAAPRGAGWAGGLKRPKGV